MKASLPIKDVEMINKMKDLFLKKGQIRDYLLFIISINTGINLKELLALKVKDVKNKLSLSLSGNKIVPLSIEVQDAIKCAVAGCEEDEPLFKGRAGQKLDRNSAFYIFRVVCSELGVQDKYSVSSLRKTFAYHYYKKYGDLSYLQWLFNQTSAEQALNYIGEHENMNLRYREGVCL